MKHLLFITFILLISFVNAQAQTTSKRLLMIIPHDLYHDTELSDPMGVLATEAIDVTICSTVKGSINGVLGGKIESTLLVSEVKVDDFDAICIMGGKGTGLYLWDDLEVRKLVVDFQQKGKLVTGICAGSVALARAGALNGKKATTFPVKKFIDELAAGAAIYSTDSVVVDGLVITGNGPVGAKGFGTAIAAKLKQ